MGNSASIPEKVFAAVQKNDVAGFQTLVATFSAAGAGNPELRASALEGRDKSGRTPLIVAAAKNHYQILQQLIALGVDVNYINPAKDSPGGALHEAAARRQEAAVEVLLAAGANPFAANAAGRTALDEAVLSGHTGVVRAIEKYAEFTGMVGFKTRAMAGLSHKYKARWAVLMPYNPFHRDGSVSTAAAAVALRRRRCLWLYKDKTSVSPRCRLWVDGATVQTHGPAGTEATLRLHTSHGEPLGDLSTSYNHGYCVTIRPADLTPPAAATYHRLIALLSRPATAATSGTGLPAPVPGARPATAPAAMPAAPPPQPGPPPPAAFYPPVPPFVAYGGGPGVVAGSYVFPPPPPPAPAAGVGPPGSPLVPQPPAYPGAAGPCLMASPLSLYQQQQQQQQQHPPRPSGGPPSVQPAAALAAQASSTPQPGAPRPVDGERKTGPVLVSGGVVVDGVFIERMAALPGESDEAFASRLASAISATSHQSQQELYPPHAAPSSNATTTHAGGGDPSQPGGGHTGPSQPPRHRLSGTGAGAAQPATSAAGAHPRTEAGGSAAPLINFQSDPGGSRPDAAAGYAAGPGGSGPQAGRPVRYPPGAAAAGALDDLDLDAVNELIAADAAAAAAAAAANAGPSGRGAGPGVGSTTAPRLSLEPTSPSAAAAGSVKEGREEAPSAPPAEAFLAPARRPPPVETDTECVICLAAPKEVGFLHGDTVHRCVCRACSAHVAVGAPCPLCRRPVERVLGVF